jgi:CheY-like chemotaxis protein
MLKLSILAVDDSPVITEMIRDSFEAEGYKVMVAEDGAEALRMALSHHPDIIIADIAMPGMDGWELCSQIRHNPFTSFIPFIFLTSRNEVPDRIRGLQMGADDYLTKPFEMDELIARVHLIFQRMRKTQESMLLRSPRTLSGSTKEMALPDLLQMFGLNQKTGLLRISKLGLPPGRIAFESGKIIKAELKPARGEKALYRLLKWEDAQFDVEPLLSRDHDPGLPKSAEEILMEGARQIDEMAELDKQLDLSGKKLRIASRPPESELSPREADLLKAVQASPDLAEVMDALSATDFEVYRMIAYFMRKGVISAE